MDAAVEATISMLEDMPKEMQEKVYVYTARLFASKHTENSPFMPMSEQQILSFLEKSRSQTVLREVTDAQYVLREIGEKHGFI